MDQNDCPPLPPNPGLSPEQVFLIAEEFCAAYGTTISHYSVFPACAALTYPRIHGICVYASEPEQARALRKGIIALEPLDLGNAEFAEIVLSVMRGRVSVDLK